MARKKPAKPPTPVESLEHKAKRTNIPTEELRDFVIAEEKSPYTVRYPRDPSLDPQLVWTGKDEQDAEDLAVPAVPIYIQEKIHPQAIIQNVRANAPLPGGQGPREGAEQIPLFADFNGLEFQDMIEFYQHDQNWSNRMILGDSLLVMTSLAEKEGLKGQVQMIYIDPPYGIKFGSNWQVSTRKRAVKDGRVEDTTRQPEQIKAFRDTWDLGIHSYLSYLRDRLVVSRDLLTDTGSMFVQIGEENVHLVRSLLDEVFGSDNFICEIAFEKRGPQPDKFLSTVNDILLWYAKDKEHAKYRRLYLEKGKDVDMTYPSVQLPNGKRRRLSKEEKRTLALLPPGARPFTTDNLTSSHYYESPPFKWNSKMYTPGHRYWSTSIAGLTRLGACDRLVAAGKTVRMLRYLDDFPVVLLSNVWTDTRPSSFGEDKLYVVQTAQRVVQRCLLLTTDPGDLVLDPTCGSGTTAYIAEQWGRRWITIDTSRVALALARTRLMAAKYPYYLLADSNDGIRKQAEITGQIRPSPLPPTDNDVKEGFVYRSVPHVTLKSIANNEEIDAIHAHLHKKLEPIREQLNSLLGQEWEEWQIPREEDDTWPDKVKEMHAQWWDLRRQRQQEIDESIARDADTELLYDQPYEDRKRIRVAGPFTVESLSPHRVISTEVDRPAAEAQDQSGPGQFETMIIENLKKAGVQNTIKNERLKFDRLEPYAGTWIQAAGEYTESDGTSRRVAVSIGPEHGTVGPDQVKQAAKQAVQGLGFDLLVICGFAFDPHVAEETRRYGDLTVLITQMNPDLAMGDTLLKKTGAGNLFMVFGEPDIKVDTQEDGRLAVSINGVDVYDPTTGQIRSDSTDDIACWFIDTNYNEESFFVRHAYFTGAGDPYGKLKRALRAEIDEAAWAALYSTTSYPFDPPQTGKIAVKAINHYGDEVLKVIDVAR